MSPGKSSILLFSLLILAHPAASQTDPNFLKKLSIASQYYSLGDYPTATQLLEPLYRENPRHPRVFDMLKECYHKQKMYPPEEKMLVEWTAQFPEDLNRLVQLGEVQLALDKIDQAEKNFQKALSGSKEKTAIYVQIAQAYLNLQMPQKAAELYLQARKDSHTPYLFALELARIYEAQDQTEKALAEYFNYYREDSTRSAEVEFRIRNLAVEKENLPVIKKFLRRKIQELPKDHLAYRLLADLYLENENYGEALNLYQTLDQLMKAQGELILSFAQECLARKKFEIAEKSVRFVLSHYPESENSPLARFILADIYQAQEKYSLALEALNQIFAASPPERDLVKGLLLAGQISFRAKDFTSALGYFGQLTKRQSFPLLVQQALLGKGDSYLALAQTDSALACYRILQKKNLSSDFGEKTLFRLGEYYFFTEEFDSASYYYDQITQKSLRSPLANDALEKLRIIAESRTQDPAGLALLAQSQWLRYQGKKTEALEKLRVLKESPGSLAELAYVEEAQVYRDEKDWPSSLTALQELVEKYPDSYYAPLALYLSAETNYEQLGKPALALELYQKILREHPRALFIDRVREKIKLLNLEPKGS